MGKFSRKERELIKTVVATLSIKRIPESEIINEIYRQTDKTISKAALFHIKQSIKKEAGEWYQKLRQGEHDYIFEFKERISEIMDLQKKAHKVFDDNEHNPSIQLDAIATLQKLNVTLSSYYDKLPSLTKQTATEQETKAGLRMSPAGHYTRMPLAENCQCILTGNHTDTIIHIECHWCMHVWCANAIKQDWCPNPECKHGIAGNEFEPWDPDYKWVECSCGMWFQRQEILDAHLSAYPHS